MSLTQAVTAIFAMLFMTTIVGMILHAYLEELRLNSGYYKEEKEAPKETTE